MATNITAITDSVNFARAPGPRQFQGLFTVIPFSASILDATLPAQTASQADIAVPGAKLGDFVLVAVAVDTTGCVLTGSVTAADVVTITFFNVEGSDVNTTLSTPAKAMKGVVLSPKWTA